MLTSLKVGNECWKYVKEVIIRGCSKLVSIEICKNSFTESPNSSGQRDKSCIIDNCDSLKSIIIGPYSFSDFNKCQLTSIILYLLL